MKERTRKSGDSSQKDAYSFIYGRRILLVIVETRLHITIFYYFFSFREERQTTTHNIIKSLR